MREVYLVCHGNTCRSLMAEEICKESPVSKGISGTTASCRGTEPHYPDDPEVRQKRGMAIESGVRFRNLPGETARTPANQCCQPAPSNADPELRL